ncbi:helix-turn-helix transcriptional regulator [Caldalkalibacillus thermarum]|uniref:helix-turn-helix transcriptional regulator n=1 Tax=Caldalkalibacillus thermarum TaxID=296745 RepID=UPI001E5FFAA1|nr:helix-turn-helix transcriptional regulator [Caldalkalibacillus thermarum]
MTTLHIGQRIVKLREKRNMSRKMLADGVASYSHMGNIELGKFAPSEQVLAKLARKLDVPEHYLLQYHQQDEKLEQKLNTLWKGIHDNLDLAQHTLHEIESLYSYIPSLEQELHYYLLKTLLYLKGHQIKEADHLLHTEIQPMVDEDRTAMLPRYLLERYYYVRALSSYHQNDYLSAYRFYLLQLPLVENVLHLTNAYYNIALTLMALDDYKNAIRYARQALAMFEELDHQYRICACYILLGVLYMDIKSYNDSESYLYKALELASDLQFSELLDDIYHNLGLLCKETGDKGKALEWFGRAQELSKRNKARDITKTCSAMIMIYLDLNELEIARKMVEKAKPYSLTEFDWYNLKALEAECILRDGRHGEFEQIMLEVVHYFHEKQNYHCLKRFAKKLADHYQRARKYKKACYFYALALEAYEQQE